MGSNQCSSMSGQKSGALAMYVERARKVLQHEQRTNHQDRAIKPGGLEVFAARWASETGAACKEAGLDPGPVRRFMEHIEGYHQQDPMQRAASLRAALAILNELDGREPERPTPVDAPSTPARAEVPGNSVRTGSAANKAASPASAAQARPVSAPPQAAQPRKNTSSDGAAAASQRTRSAPGRVQPEENPVPLEAGMSQGHTALTLLSASVTAVPGVGPTVATRLRHLGIRTIRDLLFYFPREHRDYSKLEKIAQVPFNELTTTIGLLWEVETVRGGSGRSRTIATISDDTGKMRVTWFNQSYLQKQLEKAKGEYIVVTGTKQRFGNKVEFTVRSHELPERGEPLNTGRLVPIYPLTEGLSAKALRKYTKYVVDRYAGVIPEHLPASIRREGKLLPLPEAVSQIHYPENEEMLLASRRRLGFDEFFMIHLGMQERRTRWQRETPQGNAFFIDYKKIFVDTVDIDETAADTNNEQTLDLPSTGATLWSELALDQPFEATLPFRFTNAQRRVIIEIFRDLARSQPMCRLLQGDVGAGKTAV